jgi:hypothetical protein
MAVDFMAIIKWHEVTYGCWLYGYHQVTWSNLWLLTLWLSSSDLNFPPRSIYVLFVCPLALSVSKSYHAKNKLPSKTYLYLVCLSINIVCKQIVLMLRISCPPRSIYMYVLFVCLLTLSVNKWFDEV